MPSSKLPANLENNPLYRIFKKTKVRAEKGMYDALHFPQRRNIVPLKLRALIEKELKQKLTSEFFSKLEGIGDNRDFVKVLDLGVLNPSWKGMKVVIKKAVRPGFMFTPEHGQHPKWLREDILAHHRAVRNKTIKPKSYVLRTPKYYFKHGDFIVIEYINVLSDRLVLPVDAHRDWMNAARELESNFVELNKRELLKDHIFKPPHPQVFPTPGKSKPHVMFAGYLKDGRVLLYTPYDYA